MSPMSIAALLYLGVISSPDQCTDKLIQVNCDQIENVKNKNAKQLENILDKIKYNGNNKNFFVIDEATQT